mmetsp:Transcript_21081/g.32143  ORF Transcript_21081/g.32143 Transcript_21081/m.32143 type:complete len:82 (+) Transcript_21081:68-313(+)
MAMAGTREQKCTGSSPPDLGLVLAKKKMLLQLVRIRRGRGHNSINQINPHPHHQITQQNKRAQTEHNKNKTASIDFRGCTQ